MRHIIPISGKDSLACALVQHAINDSLNYEYMFNPTGLELPEVFTWLKNVETHLKKKITFVGNDLKTIIEEYNYFLPSQKQRYCTRQSKIEPFTKWIGKDECKVYYGIRFDEQNRTGFDNKLYKNIIPEHPLIKLGIDLKGVYSIINANGLKPPVFFWEKLYISVKIILDFDPKKILDEYLFDVLFAWRSRANCDRCFNQRYYEWVGLLEHYPDLFWDAEAMEHMGSDGDFYWSSNKKSLKEISEQKDIIFKKRVDQVVKSIRKIMQLKLFEDDANKEMIDILAITSCGLFCGK